MREKQQKNKPTRKYPLAYRFGGAFFCELPFFVNRHVLIPRFDTEKLVETVILNTKTGCCALDMCTGSGCIAVVLALHGFDVTAADISRAALRVARKNARLHNVNIKFVRGDMFNPLRQRGCREATGVFDVIVSNPPYIRTADIGKYDASILHEPHIALDGGADGLDFYRIIARDAGAHLADGGRLYLEIGAEIATQVKSILQAEGWCDITIVTDARALARVIHARKNSGNEKTT